MNLPLQSTTILVALEISRAHRLLLALKQEGTTSGFIVY